MSSSLAGLWRFARAEKLEAFENFSTEALAAAIRSDPAPFVTLLHEKALLEIDLVPDEVEVVTQKPVARGAVDLAATLVGLRPTREIWLEVKIDSGISGDQIETYTAAIEERRSELPTRLAFLLKYDIREYRHLPRVFWKDVARVGRAAPSTAFLWRDLAHYLEELRVTDPYDEPISGFEAASMLEAARLLRKMRRTLRRAARHARKRWPELQFPESRGVADRFVEQQFADHSRLTIGTRGQRAQVYIGMAQQETSIEWTENAPHVAVWVEHQPKATEVRNRLIRTADEGGLPSEWQRSRKGWWALLRNEPMSAFADRETMTAWWLARLKELDESGLLSLLPRLGAPTPEDEVAAAQDAAALQTLTDEEERP